MNRNRCHASTPDRGSPTRERGVLNRRAFLAGCAGCTACALGLGASASSRALVDGGNGERTPRKARVRLVYAHVPSDRPIWPNIGYDFERRKRTLTRALSEACPDIEFLPITAMSAGEAKRLLDGDRDVDGYLVYILGLWTGAPRTLAASGKPVLLADDLYGGSGEFLIAYSQAKRAGWKTAGVSSSRIEDVAAGARAFSALTRPGAGPDAFLAAFEEAMKGRIPEPGELNCVDDPATCLSPDACLEALKRSRILVVGRNPGDLGKTLGTQFGLPVDAVPFGELDEAWKRADRGKAAAWADRWIAEADRVIEPSREEIGNSGAMYLGMKKVLAARKADAITINCLGGFYGGHLHAYPCLGFRQLNDEGRVGACEADLMSTFTMLTVGKLTGRPGFISDPVIDTSKNRIIYAHCVGPTKVFGPKGTRNPFHIRDHSEDHNGAAIRSLMPLGHMTTTLEIHALRKEIVMHQGRTVENVDEDMACRTKLAVEVKGDVKKLMREWDRWGWHRVTFFGDLREPLEALADRIGYTMIHEA